MQIDEISRQQALFLRQQIKENPSSKINLWNRKRKIQYCRNLQSFLPNHINP